MNVIVTEPECCDLYGGSDDSETYPQLVSPDLESWCSIGVHHTVANAYRLVTDGLWIQNRHNETTTAMYIIYKHDGYNVMYVHSVGFRVGLDCDQTSTIDLWR